MKRLPNHPGTDQAGFALISVLALVSLAAMTATAFLASSRLEKTAAASTGDQTRLTLALDSGYHFGSYAFFKADGSWNWVNFLMNEDADGVGYLFHGVPSTTNPSMWTNYALFSCANLTELGKAPIDPSAYYAVTTNQGGFADARLRSTSPLARMMAFQANATTNIPLLFNRTSPPVSWITNYVTNPANTNQMIPNFRFAYFTEDPSGLIDAERMGGLANRNTGTNPAEIAVSELGITNLAGFTNLRNLYLTPGVIQQVLLSNNLVATNTVTNPWRYLSSSFYSMNGLLTDTNTRRNGLQKIPRGLGYRQPSSNNQPNKTNLNGLFANGTAVGGAISTIVSTITTNLPSFGNRGGAMAADRYLSNLAANILDYADNDSDPTTEDVTLPTLPSWRGVESLAWPNEIFTRFHFENSDTKAVATGFQYSFKYKHYLEVWNIGNTEVPLNNLLFSNNRSFLVRIPPNTFNLSDTNRFGPVSMMTLTPVGGSPATLKPGEFGMLESPTMTLRYIDTSKNTAANVQFQDWNGNSSVILTTNGKVISATRANQLTYNKDILSGSLYGVANGVNFATSLSYACQSTYRAGPPNLKSVGGDPRAQLFLGTWPTKGQLYVGYSSPGGLNWESGNLRFSNGYVNAQTLWADGGVYRARDLGENPATYGTSPEELYNRRKGTWSTDLALAKMNNTGSFSNVCELGNIFDPMQWEDASQLPPAAGGMPGLWTNLTPGATPTNVAGGRTTLRIGRPEFSRFAFTNNGSGSTPYPNMQMSAAALLDLFCATPTAPLLTGRYDDGNQININTAPPRVLAALAAGVVLSNDPAMLPRNNLRIPATAISNFVKGVTNFRAKYPFYSPSQLAFIGTNAGWPNTNVWPADAVFSTNGTGVTGWNDAAAEEWFSKIYSLSKVETRNFRIYVLAQLIKTRGTNATNVSGLVFSAPARRYYDILNQQNNVDPPTCSVYLLRKVDY